MNPTSCFVRLLPAVILLLVFPQFSGAQQLTLKEQLKEWIAGRDATVGVAVKYPDGTLLSLNNEVHYPMMSVFKFHLALAVMNYMAGREDLTPETVLHIRESELLHNTYSPIKQKYPEGDVYLSINDLLYYTVSLSDNNGCDILINFIGGIEAVDAYIRELGITGFSIKATEKMMHDTFDNQYLNWSFPEAAVELMELFLSRDILPTHYREQLYDLLVATRTGANKLKAGLPEGVVLGHKTGSSFRSEEGMMAADNDLGFVVLPDSSHYTIAVFIKDSMESDQTNAAITAGISRMVYQYLLENETHTQTNED